MVAKSKEGPWLGKVWEPVIMMLKAWVVIWGSGWKFNLYVLYGEVAENLTYMFSRFPIGARLLTVLGSSFPWRSLHCECDHQTELYVGILRGLKGRPQKLDKNFDITWICTLDTVSAPHHCTSLLSMHQLSFLYVQLFSQSSHVLAAWEREQLYMQGIVSTLLRLI